MLEICREHGWDVSSEGAVNRLAGADLLHFDEGDYDLLAQGASDSEHELRGSTWLPEAADGRPDYDRACAIEIVARAGVMASSVDREGIVTQVERDYDFTGFDRQAFQTLCWVAEGLKRQWGDEMYSRPPKPQADGAGGRWSAP